MIPRIAGILFILIIQPLVLYSQGLFHLQKYSPDDYDNFRQNWAVSQDDTGYIIVGNSAGLILYDGVEWRSNHVDVGGVVRHVTKFQNSIHWSGRGDLGYVGSDTLYYFSPVSLRSRIDSTHQQFGDIWQMFEHGDELYYRTLEGLYIQGKDSIRFMEFEERISAAFSMQDQLLLNIRNQPLAIFDGDQIKNIPGSDSYGDDLIYVVLPMEKDYLFISKEQGFMRFDGERLEPFQNGVSDYVSEHDIYRGIFINESEIALATLRGGIVIINTEGELQQIITEEYGLPTNIIYGLFLDNEETLWVATDNGLAKILVNNPVTLLNEYAGFPGSALFIEPFEEDVYIGSTEGLFVVNETGLAERFPGISGRVFDAINTGKSLILTGADGVFQLSGQNLTQLSSESFTKFSAIKGDEGFFLGARQHSVYRLSVIDGILQQSSLIELEPGIRDLYLDGENLWIAGRDRNVYRKNTQTLQLKQYDIPISEEDRLEQIGYMNGTIALATNRGLYMYDEPEDVFKQPNNFTDPEITSFQVTRFQQCSEDEIWFRNNRKIKRALFRGGEWEVNTDPYRTIGAHRDETITSIHCNENGSLWFGGTSNTYHLSDPDWIYDYSFSTNITAVLIHGDSLLYGGYGEPATIPQLAYENNHLRFTYAAASFIDPARNSYRVRLRGYEDEWSGWTEETLKDYTFIREGTYTFEVQGRNVYHKTGSIASFTFSVMPPWYRTLWAYIGYLLLAGGVLYGGYRLRLQTILREQRIRDGIARDLHDELSSTLSSINFFADAINSKKLDVKESNRFLSLIRKSSQEAKEKISDIVWVIHTENDDWENLLLRCKRFAADMLDARDIRHNFIIKGEFTGKPAINKRKNIWLTFREILTNIARHAGAEQVNILFSAENGRLHISIEDDGIGFEPDRNRDGNGILNIRERVNQLKGTCTLNSQPGKGTTWIIELPGGK